MAASSQYVALLVDSLFLYDNNSRHVCQETVVHSLFRNPKRRNTTRKNLDHCLSDDLKAASHFFHSYFSFRSPLSINRNCNILMRKVHWCSRVRRRERNNRLIPEFCFARWRWEIFDEG